MDHSTISYTIFNFLLGSNQKWFQCTFEPQMIDRERRSRTGVEVVVVVEQRCTLPCLCLVAIQYKIIKDQTLGSTL